MKNERRNATIFAWVAILLSVAACHRLTRDPGWVNGNRKSGEYVVVNTNEDFTTSESTKLEEETEEPMNNSINISLDDALLIAKLTVAEAGNESILGKRLVIDTVLNRLDSEYFPNTVQDVIYQKDQYVPAWSGSIDNVIYVDDVFTLVIEELTNRTNSEVLYFRAERYHEFGKPLLVEGNHYFSTR